MSLALDNVFIPNVVCAVRNFEFLFAFIKIQFNFEMILLNSFLYFSHEIP